MGSLHVSRQPTWRRSCRAITYWRSGTGAYKQGRGLTMETRRAAEEVGGQHIGAVGPSFRPEDDKFGAAARRCSKALVVVI